MGIHLLNAAVWRVIVLCAKLMLFSLVTVSHHKLPSSVGLPFGENLGTKSDAHPEPILKHAAFVFASAASVCYRQAVSMRFKPISEGPPFSFITREGAGGIIKRSEALPRIIIQILDSDGAVDATANSVEITASSNANLNREGVTVRSFRGEAHFTRIILEGLASSMTLTFTAKAQDTLVSAAIQGATLKTGNFTVIDRDPGMWNLSFVPYANTILRAGQPLVIASGVVVPPIKVSIISANYQIYPTQTQMATTNVTAIATIDSPLASITGNVALAYEGVFLFEDMVITTTASELPPITFRVIEGNTAGTELSISTGPVSVRPATDYSHIAFLDESRSFIYGQGVSIFAVNGIPLPPIRIGVFDTVYRRSPAITGLVITASCNRAKLKGNVVGVVDGEATFDSLTFYDVLDVGSDGADKPFTIVFTAGSQGDLPLKGDTLYTGAIFVNTVIRPATSIRFLQGALDSLFTARDQKKQVVYYLKLAPVRIELLNNANQRDTETAMTFTAVAMPSNMLEGTTHLGSLNGGVATFSSLQFPSRTSLWYPRLTFSARDNTTTRFSLVTGFITVTNSQPNYNLRFQPYGVSVFSQEGTAYVATVGVPLSPPIVIELISSAGSLDVTSSEIGITATADGAELANSFVRVTNGVAIFSSLTFVSENVGSFVLTFTAGSEGNQLVQGKTIKSGPVQVVAAELPASGLRFAREESYFPFEGCVVPVTSGSLIPPVVLELLTSNGNVDVSTTTVRVSCSATSGRWANGAVTDKLVTNGRVVFDTMVLTGAFSPAVSCCARSTNPNDVHAVEGVCATTGPLSFSQVGGAVGKLIFLNSSQVSRDVRLAYLKNVTIDSGGLIPAAIGFTDTSGRWSKTEAAIDVSVSCNFALRPPLTVRMESHGDGQWYALFSQLQFSGDVPPGVAPIITFSAPDLQPITTGLITVSGSSRMDGVDVTVDVYYSFRSFDFASWRADLCARLNIDVDRIIARRIDAGGGKEKSVPTEDTLYIMNPSWYGTRVDLRVLEPLPTSRITKRAADVAALILALKTDCDSTSLRLRRAYLSAQDDACDFGLFDEQQNGARQCIETQGKDGYCECHIPMFASVGENCLGYSPLTDLCLGTLIPNAKCQQPTIASVCNQLVFGEVPRTAVAGSGLFLFIFFPPLAYLYATGYFVRLSRPNTRNVRLPHAEPVLGEEDFE